MTKKFIIFLVTISFLSLNIFYGNNRIEKIENTEKKMINPSIKLISPRFEIERFFIDEPIKKKINELIKVSYPLNKEFLLIYPEGMTSISELNNDDVENLLNTGGYLNKACTSTNNSIGEKLNAEMLKTMNSEEIPHSNKSCENCAYAMQRTVVDQMSYL